MNRWFVMMATALALVVPGQARTADGFDQLRASDPINPSKAYIMLRLVKNPMSAALSPVFLRVPDDGELARYDAAKQVAFDKARPKLEKARAGLVAQKADVERSGRSFDRSIPPPPSVDTFNFEFVGAVNLFALSRGKIFARDGEDTIYLVAVQPGSYVLYGLAWGPGLHQCFCFGTVGFDATAGSVTDLGRFIQDRADKVSAVPELTAETGLRETGQSDMRLFSAAIRPVASWSVLPAAFAGVTVRAAGYEAIGAYVEPGAILAQRLAPIPGVLDYREGHPIDVRTGAKAQGNR